MAFDAADAKNWVSARRLASQTNRDWMKDYIDWRHYRSRDDRAQADDILRFLEEHPAWPEKERLTIRAAEALLLEGYTREQEQRWQKATGRSDYLFKAGWIEGDYYPIEQKKLLTQYRSKLNHTLIEARVDALLWKRKASSTRDLLQHTRRPFRQVAEARIAYITRASNVAQKLNALSQQQRKSPALLFDRIKYFQKTKQHTRAEQFLRQLPATVPHGEKWWPLWRYYAREALSEGRYRDAYAILRPIQHAERGIQAQLFWLRGWILLDFLKKPRDAYKDFYTFYEHVGTPVSKSRGAYWAGRAAAASGHDNIAQNWYKQSQQHASTFYGQLAALKLRDAVSLPLTRERLSPQRSKYHSRQLRLIKALARYKQSYSVEEFLLNLAQRSNNNERELAALAETARDIDYPHLAIRLGKKAFGTSNEWIQMISHPLPSLPRGLAVEPALVLAISRQESEFDPNARSHANALGLMQLLPSTARLVARNNGISHSTDKLKDPNHNMRLGSLYLAELIEKFNGHYPLAIAAYNAGPGRAEEWLERFGDFPTEQDDITRWLEQIPFSETRNYVQRVLENLQVYRRLLDTKQPLTSKRMFSA